MRKLLIIPLLLISVYLQSQVIITADHTVVDDYYSIPDRWIDSINTKLAWIHGASHATALYNGFDSLAKEDARLGAKIWYQPADDEPPEAQSDSFRIGREDLGGHGVMTAPSQRSHMEENLIGAHNTSYPDNQYDYWMYGWSYEQATWGDTSDTRDPYYDVPWAGSSAGAENDTVWGLDSDDTDITGNVYCNVFHIHQLDTMEAYMRDNDYDTRIIYNTGIADGDEATLRGYQRAVKNQHIRDSLVYITNADTVYFLDYEDILVYNDEGELNTVNWDDNGEDRAYRHVHADNMTPNNATY